jgi:hypothetical protein
VPQLEDGAARRPVFDPKRSSPLFTEDFDLRWAAFIAWLDHWQTLISGVLAVAAAAVSIGFLSKQIRQVDKQEQERQRRRHAAARATLPLALSQICDYTEVAVRELDVLRQWLNSWVDAPDGPRVSPPRFSRPEPPLELIASLERMIEATGDGSITGVLSDIIADMQVLAANLRNLSGKEGRQRSAVPNIDAYMFRAAKVFALAAHVFPYARRERERLGEFDAAVEVEKALKLMGLNEVDHAWTFKFAQRAAGGRGTVGGTSAA